MQRARRRPGAPRGNVNAVKTGNHSRRMLLVALYIAEHPDPRALARELHEAGFIPGPTHRFNNDFRGLVAYLYPRLFPAPAPPPEVPPEC
jgi:hypothetical protein